MSEQTKTAISTPITLTEGALTALRGIISEQELTKEHGLRVGVKGGGCSGFSYVLGFDVQKDNDDAEEARCAQLTHRTGNSHYSLR